MKKIFKIFAAVLAFAAGVSATAQSRKVEAWDFGGVEEAGAVNHITASTLDSLEGIAADGKFTAGDWTFGDLTLKTDKNDRAYYNGAKNYGTQGYSSFTFDDGYAADGMYYCNGKGGDSKRYMLLKNVKAGDTVTFYGRISNSSEDKIHFSSVKDSGEADGVQDETAWLTTISKRFTFIASSNSSYKVWTETANGAKPVYYRIVRKPGVAVSGSLTGLPAGTAQLKFVDIDTKQELPATLKGKSYTAGLSQGHKYTAVLSGIKAHGIASDSKQVDVPADKSAITKNLTVAEMKTYIAQGAVTGFSKDYNAETAVIVLNPPAGSLYQPVEATVTGKNGEFTYRAELEPAVAYTAVLKGANDYQLKGNTDFEGTEAFTKDIEVEAVPVFDVNGKFIGITNPMPSSISFKNLEDGYEYKGAAANGIYGIKLRNGKYQVFCETDKTTTINHIVVNGAGVTKDILMAKKDKSVQQIPLKKDIYVGGKKPDYASVKEAATAAHAMAPQSEADRITIHIAPGVYRDQVIIDTPYITLKNDTPSQEVKLTWYYGIGYIYYSADKNGFYDAELAYDKFDKKTPAKWGVATYVKKEALFFRAEGITFETSFNKYVTAEELADGVESDGSISFVRKLNSDVQSKKATERSAAMYADADQSEFINCKFLGSQDTLYTGKETRQYFRNCFIEGNTDFIFGDGDIVYENCEINIAGYSDSKNGGYITAAREANQKGLLFYNCVINADMNNMQFPGVFGRPWGPAAKVAFVNTVLGYDGIIEPAGWTSMSGNSPKDANFFEYNTMWDKAGVDVSHRNGGKIISDAGAYSPKNYFINWTPVYYNEPAAGEAKIKKQSFTTDDDINTPYPGHTITLHYEFSGNVNEDISLIQWFRTKDKKDVLIKQSTGFGDKSYLISTADSGFNIKCVITPKLRGGEYGKPVTVNLDKKINEGYAIPAKATSVRPRAEGKVNVFLASDSTCKDYSALGMWNAGQTRNEGAWGEFLQCFFNGAVSVQNYANGGRSSRNFINEGSLEKIRQQISKGDYLFIQFGHNDCSNASGYLEDRYVPLGEPNKKGIFPIKEGKKVRTPDSYIDKYGTTFYSWDCGATYKWYLMQYVNVAREAGATPVLVTPVSRQYFDGKGRITPHHDSKDTATKTQITRNNAYVEAVRQLAKEQKIILIDGFEMTKALYEKAYNDCGSNIEARELMFAGDSTHNNKLGGFVIAGEFAKAIKSTKGLESLAPSIVHPRNAMGENMDGSLMFTVNQDGKMDSKDAYWQRYEQGVMDSLGK